MELKQWNPGDLLQFSGSYWSVCTLHAAVKLDLLPPCSETTDRPGLVEQS